MGLDIPASNLHKYEEIEMNNWTEVSVWYHSEPRNEYIYQFEDKTDLSNFLKTKQKEILNYEIKLGENNDHQLQ